jgi:hypothetical protein
MSLGRSGSSTSARPAASCRRGLLAVVCLVALLAAGATPAGGASGNGLVLKTKNGGPVSAGAPITLAIEVGPEGEGFSCGQELGGTVAVNGKPKDKVTFPSGELHGSCTSETTKFKWSAALATIELSSKGKIILRARATAKLIEPTGSCTYEVKKISGPMPIPGQLSFSFGATGKLNKPLSQGTCEEKTLRFTFSVVLTKTETKEVLET